MFKFDDVLLLILIIIFPIVFYHALLINKNDTSNKITLGLLCTVSIFLCMTFPLTLSAGQIYDLRTIPWLISVLYGGFATGIFTTTAMLIYRFYIGGDGFYIAAFAYISTFIIIIFFVNRFKSYHFIKRILCGLSFTIINTLLVLLGALFFIIKHNMEFHVDFYISLILIHALTICLVIYLIEVLHEKERLKHEIYQSDKRNAISQLAASVAHEIRNPLTVVRGFLQIFSTDSSIPEKQKNYLKIMIDELDKAQYIINDYLSLAKPHTENLENVNVTQNINTVIDIINSYATINNIEIQKNVEQSLNIKANRIELNQVLINIIKNAIEAIQTKHGVIQIFASKKDGFVIIDVIDNGIGMTSEEIMKLGCPYYSTKEKGTGIGLTLCFQIIEKMKGKIEIKSKKGISTKFSLKIPVFVE